VPREEYDWYASHLLEQEAFRRPAAADRCASPSAAGPAPGPDCPASPESADSRGPRDVEDAAPMDADEESSAHGAGGGGGVARKSMEEVGKVRSFCDVAAAAAGFLPPSSPA
jgi:hypothetical protein